MVIGGFCISPQKGAIQVSSRLENDPLPLLSVFIDHMHVRKVPIEVVVPRRSWPRIFCMAAREGCLSAGPSWQRYALRTCGATFWEMRARSVTRLMIFCTGCGSMTQRSFSAKYEIVRELAQI